MTDVLLGSLGSAHVGTGHSGVQHDGVSAYLLAHSVDEYGGYLPLNPNMAIPQEQDTALPPWSWPSGDV